MALAKQLAWTWILAITFTFTSLTRTEDLPCRERNVGIEGRSVVCVCDANYCDTITRVVPDPGTFVIYTTSSAGQRFAKSFGVIQTDPDPEPEPEDTEEDGDDGGDDGSEGDTDDVVVNDEEETAAPRNVSLRIYTNRRFQYVEGFGGSVTDAASLNWRDLSDGAQAKMIETYFGEKGIEYNMIRIPIAGCDFSTHPYTYNEYPWGDAALSNFSLAPEDLFYKLPMIRRALRVSTDEIKITASAWSPPIWMKTNERITGFGQLRPQYYQAFADYHLRFIEEYNKANVKIWAITTTNEPINGIVPLAPFNSLGWLPSQMARWVANNLGPTIRNSQFNNTLILGIDDQRYLLHYYLEGMRREDPRAVDYLDGIAIHYYGNFFHPRILTNIQRRVPGKILLSTEACEGAMPWHANRLEIGSWARARRYARYIMQDLNNYVVGWIDWNLCLSPTGGPNWANNFVDSPILVFKDQDEFIKQPMFYAMGHFSKFIPRGSRRIRMARRSLATVQNVAFLNPSGNIVVVVQNTATNERNVRIRISNTRFVEFTMEPLSIKSIEINHN
ncbi:lysosomal acid glucosylceramidase-like [Pectinophora gossypiella]|uniref:lysosomal acid glucosylceramidase-like n=1 Tax=Pectinophora gossypiella TaxID=13191 RepID=UPI00214F2C3F|nr:lysosomal acid glucosylceramidase-like [Pectinophora gossypiella]XP_049888140.1 lysosomal acid glucosylceramidase-like [Pectinophora gossypiella]XP_049888141.1 lysosomal acid glucosylceramidase-like [Pectinophora gossypiella]XP_049888142.1 lysosomal acid glucosylceramidase-like [Pectinophora gossypiella]